MKISVDRNGTFWYNDAVTNEKGTQAMTQADKTDILNLINNANNLAKVAEDANAVYHDRKIADFAKSAMDDAKSTKKFIMKVLQENLYHFVNPNCIRIGGGCFGYQEIELFNDKKLIKVSLGEMFYARIRVWNWTQRMDKPHTFDEVYISSSFSDMIIEDIYTYTSDTFLKIDDWEYKNESIYNVCTNEDLFYKPGNTRYYLPGKYDPKTWKKIYGNATWTRAKTAFLVYCLKKTLAARVDGLRNFANEREATREENGKIAAYKKVSL